MQQKIIQASLGFFWCNHETPDLILIDFLGGGGGGGVII